MLAAYGVLQSLTRERDLAATLESVARVIVPGGLFGVDLVPDVPNWREYKNRVQLRGRAAGGAHLTLIESVRAGSSPPSDDVRAALRQAQGRRPRRGASLHADVSDDSGARMVRRLERAGFRVETLLGDYQGRPWDARADVWILLAKKV